MAFQPGQFCWIELATPDDQAAAAFYGAVFGWEFRRSPLPDGRTYTMALLGGKDVGGIFVPPPHEAHIPPHWAAYIMVASADDAVRAVEAAGGATVEPAFDVMEYGRMAVLRDPTGAIFQAWQPKAHGGAGAYRVGPGGWSWVELATRDPERARAFYEQAFGWKSKVSPGYTEFTLAPGADEFAGMLQIGEDQGPVPPHWAVYFDTDDTDATVARAKAAGGGVQHGPIDIPHVGRIATLRDPQGAAFSVYQREASRAHG